MTKDELSTLIKAHQAELFRYLRYMGATTEQAEDIVQETFIAAYKAKTVPNMDNDRVIAAWLRRIARNKFCTLCRQHKKHLDALSELKDIEVENFWTQSFLREDSGFDFYDALDTCLEVLPKKSMKILNWFYAEKLSRDKTAQAAGMSQDGIKSHLRRVRQKLAECVLEKLNAEKLS